MINPGVEYFLECLKESLKRMTCDRVENQVMQVMGFGGNRLRIEKNDIGALFCNLVSIVLREIDASDEGYNEFVESFRRSYDAILHSNYKEGIRKLKSNNKKSFVIVPILGIAQSREAKHMFFAVVTKVLNKYQCVLVNKGYRPDDAFTYQRCVNKTYKDLVSVFGEDKLLKVCDIYEQLSDVNVEGVNAMDQKVGNCACKNMEAAINSALCDACPKYKKYGKIPAGVMNKVDLHKMYIDNLKESIRDIPKFRDIGFERVLEGKWKEYIYNKEFIEKMNKIRKRYLEKKLSKDAILEIFEDEYFKDELDKIGKDRTHNDPSDDEWEKYIYDKAFKEVMNSVESGYVADEEEFFNKFIESFKEENIRERLKYVSANTLMEWYENFLLLSKSRVKKLSKILYLVDRKWLDKIELEKMSSRELDIAVGFLKPLEEYFPMALREMRLNYTKAYLRIGKLKSDNNYDMESLKSYQKGVRCNPYKVELEEVFEDTYDKIINREEDPHDKEYRFVLNGKDRRIYELLNSDYMKGKKKIFQSLNIALLKNKELIKKAFVSGDDTANYLKVSDIDLSEIQSDIKNMGQDDTKDLLDVVSKVSDRSVLECIDFDNINKEELFFKGLREGNFELTSMLLNNGMKLDIEDEKGNTPLMLACVGGNKDNVNLIISKNAKMKEKYAGGCNIISFINDYNIKMDIAKLLIDKMNLKEELDRGFEENGSTVLMYACRKNNVDVVRLLLECGVDVNGTDKYGNTALKDISSMPQNSKNIEIMKLLIENNADVNKENYRNVTALMMASCNGNVEFVKLLLLAGADKNKKNKNNRTALDMAIDNEYERIERLLEDDILEIPTRIICNDRRTFDSRLIN